MYVLIKRLLNCDGKAFLLKLQLHDEFCGRRGMDGRGVLPKPNFWLSVVIYLCINWHLSPFVKLRIGHGVQLNEPWAE